MAEVLRSGERPAQLHVTTGIAKQVFQPLASVSNTKVVQQSQFQQLHDLLQMMGQL